MMSASFANSLGWIGGKGPAGSQRRAPLDSTPMLGISTTTSPMSDASIISVLRCFNTW